MAQQRLQPIWTLVEFRIHGYPQFPAGVHFACEIRERGDAGAPRGGVLHQKRIGVVEGDRLQPDEIMPGTVVAPHRLQNPRRIGHHGRVAPAGIDRIGGAGVFVVEIHLTALQRPPHRRRCQPELLLHLIAGILQNQRRHMAQQISLGKCLGPHHYRVAAIAAEERQKRKKQKDDRRAFHERSEVE